MSDAAPSVLRSVGKVAGGTAVSRIAGLVREVLMAQFFGTSLETSAFVVAFRIPNLFRKLFGEGALSSAFIPAYAEAVARGGRAAGERLLAKTAGFVIAVLGGVAALGVLATFPLQAWMAATPRFAAILPLLRIMLPYAPLICVAALAMGALNVLRAFWVPALAPALLNIIWILVLVGVCPFVADDPGVRIRIVAWAVLAAGVAQALFQVVALRRLGVRFIPDLLWWNDPQVRRVLQRALPLALASGVVQVNVCIDGLLAMWAGKWAPAALEYADRLVYLPLGLVGTAFATVLLPTFSRQAAAADPAAIPPTLDRALRNIALLMSPAAVGLLVLALPIIQLVYQGGRFDAESALYSSRALAFYAPGLLVFCLHKAITPAFYALGDTVTPVRVSLVAVALNVVMNVLFVVTWPAGWKHAGIALATVISSGVSVLLLVWLLRRKGCVLQVRGMLGPAGGALAAAGVMAVAACLLHARLATAFLEWGKSGQLVAMAVTLASSAVIYGGLVWVLCRSAVRELVHGFRKT